MIRDCYTKDWIEQMGTDQWMMSQNTYDPEENLKFESLFALSNGYLGIRGSHEEGTKITLPYLYVNGVFDKSETFMRELAALPNWLGIRLYVEKELIGIENCEILEFSRTLDMRQAVLYKHLVLKDKKGRITKIDGRRFVSRNNVHRMGIELQVTPVNYSGMIEAENIIDGTIINFYDAPRFKVKHMYMTANEKLDTYGAYIETATRERNLHVGTGCILEAYKDGKKIMRNRMFHAFGEQAVEFGDFTVKQGETVQVVKYVSIQGDFELDRAVRFNIFHLMSTGNETDDKISVGAKLLTGEEYSGHAFWDIELFMLPFYSYVFPKMAKNLESYRYYLLDAARDNAKKNGYKGAQYPWESADDGTEQCPDWTIEPDGTCYRCYVADYEHHVTADVAYGIYDYVKITNDKEFLVNEGAEILTETARFWASRCEYVEEKDQYEINQVTGPDEWHEPVNNNLYTNYFARWNLRYVMELADLMKQKYPEEYKKLAVKTGLTEGEIQKWEEVQKKIYLPRKEGTNLLEQFEGYFQLKDVVIDQYDENDWPIRPEILKECPTRETQILKQPDVVLLLHLLGEEFDQELIKENYDYYEKRTLHGSSLSPSIYSVMGLKVGDDSRAYRYLKRAAFIDLLNLQKNIREGIHAANAGGVWQTVVFGFAGVSMDAEGMLHIQPHMPKEWNGLTFRIHSYSSWIEIQVQHDNRVNVKLLSGEHIKIKINGVMQEI